MLSWKTSKAHSAVRDLWVREVLGQGRAGRVDKGLKGLSCLATLSQGGLLAGSWLHPIKDAPGSLKLPQKALFLRRHCLRICWSVAVLSAETKHS